MFDVEIAIEKVKKKQINCYRLNCGSTDSVHKVLVFTILLILCGVRKKWHNHRGSGNYSSLYRFIERVMKLIVVTIQGYQCHQLHTKSFPIFCFQI